MTACRHCGLPGPGEFCCFGCRLANQLVAASSDAASSEQVGGDAEVASEEVHRGSLFVRLGAGVFLSVNLMAVSGFSYAREVFGEAASRGANYEAIAGLFAYLQMFLATAILVLLGFPLLAGTERKLKLDGNLLVGIAVVAAYVLSVHSTLQGEGSLYFDTMAGVLVMVTFGKLLEARARRRATSAARALHEAVPQRAFVERSSSIVEIDARDVEPGQRVRVLPGELVPVDGRVVEGRSHLENSGLTGESRAKAVAEGDEVLAGAMNLEGMLWLEAERTGAQRLIAQLGELLERARNSQPEIQRLADRIAAFFVPGVTLLALSLLAFHLVEGNTELALLVPLSVLLISCPCAFGIAAPLASWSALRRCATAGVSVDQAATLERAARLQQVLFDKTGTLTTARPELEAVSAFGINESQALEWAAGLESASNHPIAQAILDAAAAAGIQPEPVLDARVEPGRGVEAVVAGQRLRLANRRWVRELGLDPESEEPGPYLLADDQVLARFELSETLHPSARRAVHELKQQGLRVSVLTGDDARPANRLARELGVGAQSELLPEDKLRALNALRSSHGPAAVVGDGLNDGPVLGGADVGIAISTATDLANSAGSVRLIHDDLRKIPYFFAVARHTVARMRLSLAWAFGYNTVGIVLAATGRLSPVFAASAMVLSSLMVIWLARGAGDIDEALRRESPHEAQPRELALQT